MYLIAVVVVHFCSYRGGFHLYFLLTVLLKDHSLTRWKMRALTWDKAPRDVQIFPTTALHSSL